MVRKVPKVKSWQGYTQDIEPDILTLDYPAAVAALERFSCAMLIYQREMFSVARWFSPM